MIAMLRSVGIPAKYIIGHGEGNATHAWVVALIDDKEIGFDLTSTGYITPGEEYYGMQRWY